MTVDKIVNVFAGITVLAIVSVVVGSPQSAKIIQAIGNAYATSIRAARGGSKF